MKNNRKPTLLAIDDDEITLNSILSSLKRQYHVKAFTSGATALDYLTAKPADLILMDVKMPAMSGYETLEKLRSDTKTQAIPVIFLTSSLDEKSEVQALEKGAADYIVKPIKPPVLRKRIHMQLELQNFLKNLEMLVEEKTEDLRLALSKVKNRENIILSLLARVTDLRDSVTGNHIERITEYTRIIVNALLNNRHPDYKLTAFEADDIVHSAKLHDLGKIAVPDQVLLKPGKLTTDEFEIVKQHAVKGADLLNEVIVQLGDDSFLRMAHEIALGHHEKWNGQGYPHKLKGRAIPISARIVALADVYDALTHARPYKSAFSHEQTVELIEQESGSHFDPYIVQIFLDHQKEFAYTTYRIE